MGDDGLDEEARQAFQGILNVRFFEPTTVAYDDFKYRVRHLTAQPPFNIHLSEELEVLFLCLMDNNYTGAMSGTVGKHRCFLNHVVSVFPLLLCF